MKWEAQNLSRQHGYCHMGVIRTSRRLGFITGADNRRCALDRLLVLGAESRRFVVHARPTMCLNLVRSINDFEKKVQPVTSPADLPRYMVEWNAAIASVLGLQTWGI